MTKEEAYNFIKESLGDSFYVTINGNNIISVPENELFTVFTDMSRLTQATISKNCVSLKVYDDDNLVSPDHYKITKKSGHTIIKKLNNDIMCCISKHTSSSDKINIYKISENSTMEGLDIYVQTLLLKYL